MESASIFYVVIVALAFAAPFPIGAILKRDGRNPYWALLYFVPIVNYIALWFWAYGTPSEIED